MEVNSSHDGAEEGKVTLVLHRTAEETESGPVSSIAVRCAKEYPVERSVQTLRRIFCKHAVLHQERKISVLLGPNIAKQYIIKTFTTQT